MKDRVVNKVMLLLSGKVEDGELLAEIKNALHVALLDMEVRIKPDTTTALVPAAKDESRQALMMFFVAKRIEGLSDKSLYFYKMELFSFFDSCQKDINDIRTDDIRYYLATRGAISKVTLDNKRRILSSFFTWLTDEDYIVKNPMARIRAIKQGKVVKKAFSEHEIECLRDAAANIRELAVVDLLLSTGMRCGELHILDRDHVDFRAGEVTVLGKGGKERVCYMNPKASKHLSDYLSTRQDLHPALLVSQDGQSRRLGISGIEKMMRDLGTRAGVSDTHPHRFRRTAATLAINRGMPVEQVQHMLGHEQIETTMRYAIVAGTNVKSSHAKFLV